MMRLHEYQAKSIFSKHGIRLQRGKVIERSEKARLKRMQLKLSKNV